MTKSMIRNQDEWWEWCMEHGTDGSMVFNILEDWKLDKNAAQKLTQIYFEIASEAIGEESVRTIRDERIKSREQSQE